MNKQKLHQIIKEEYVNIMLNKKIDEATINLTPEEMDKLHSNGSVNVGEDTVTYKEPENPTPVTEGNNTQYSWSQINKALMKFGMSPRNIGEFLLKLKRTTESKLTEKLARGLKPLLQLGSTIKSNAGENVLVKLSDKFDRIDDEQADDVASHLNMAIELMQDGSPSEARAWLKKFNNACKDALKGKPIKSAFEGVSESKLTEAKSKKVTKQMWVKMSEYQRMDALLTVVKDPDKAEKFLDKKWNQLPSGFERDMYTEAYEPPKKKDGTVDWDAIANDPKNLHKNPKKGYMAKHLKTNLALARSKKEIEIDGQFYERQGKTWHGPSRGEVYKVDEFAKFVTSAYVNKQKVKVHETYGQYFGGRTKRLPKRFTVKTKQTIDGTVYSPGDYALKKKRAGGGIYLNMDKGEMLGVDAMNISKLEEAWMDLKDILKEIDFKDTIGKAIKNPTKIVSNIEQLLIKKGKKNRNKKITWKDVQVLQDKLDDIGVNASISYDRIARELEYDLDEGKLREMIYSELFNNLKNGGIK